MNFGWLSMTILILYDYFPVYANSSDFRSVPGDLGVDGNSNNSSVQFSGTKSQYSIELKNEPVKDKDVEYKYLYTVHHHTTIIPNIHRTKKYRRLSHEGIEERYREKKSIKFDNFSLQTNFSPPINASLTTDSIWNFSGSGSSYSQAEFVNSTGKNSLENQQSTGSEASTRSNFTKGINKLLIDLNDHSRSTKSIEQKSYEEALIAKNGIRKLSSDANETYSTYRGYLAPPVPGLLSRKPDYINPSIYTYEDSSDAIERIPFSDDRYETLKTFEDGEGFSTSDEMLSKVDSDSHNQIGEHVQEQRIRQEKSVDLDYHLGDLNGLLNSEFNAEFGKYRSHGIEPEALIAAQEDGNGNERSSDFKNVTSLDPRRISPYNYLETSYLITSDIEMNKAPFVVDASILKKAKQLELQDEDLNNITHAAAVTRKATDKSVYVIPPLTVELGEGTSLLLTANIRQELYYEVTNNLNSAVRVNFEVRDSKRILLNIDKYAAVLGPRESTTVRVTVLPRSNLGPDTITFLATGSEQVKKEVIVDIDQNYGSDDDYPDIDYNFSSDCTDVLLSKCQHGTWTIKVSARDPDSGLMLLTTIPKGLYFPDGYVAGTNAEVTGYYSDSCCNPDLQIIAVDRMNNRIVKQVNAYRAPLSFWAIAAIILISLIIIVIIVICVIFCVKKFKKNEADSFELPTYRGGSGRSRY